MRTITPMPDGGVEVYDIDSGIGGAFTVSIVRELDEDLVEVRICYGEATERGWTSYHLFDGTTFEARRNRLTNRRTLFRE